MNSSDPLHALLGYRFRRRRATDGAAYRTRSGQRYAGEPAYEDPRGNWGVYGADDDYDPVNMRYPLHSRYDSPTPWEAIELRPRTSMLRLELPALAEPPPLKISYEDSVMTPEVSELIWHNTLDQINRQLAAEQQPEPIPLDHTIRFRDEARLHVPDPITPDQPLEARMITPFVTPRDGEDPLPPMQTNGHETPESNITMPERRPAMADPYGIAADAPETVMVPGPTLDIIVDQLGGGPHPGPPDEPAPYLLMNQLYNQQMQMMDPFAPPGPMM